MAKKGTGGNVAGKVDGTIGVGKSFDTACYPSTIDFASKPSENKSLVDKGRTSRRPGGSMRGSGPWHTACCHPGTDGSDHHIPNEQIQGKNGAPD